MGKKSAMRPSWTYKLGENIISIAKEEKNLGVVIHDNLSQQKHINRIFGNTFMMLRNIRMAFHFFRKRYDEKNYKYNDQTKTGICRSNMVPTQEKACFEIRKNTENCN